MEIKLNDVYSFKYNDKYSNKIFMSDHCFDGQLIVKENSKGELYLEDTYYDHGNSYNRTFTPEKALEQGKLTFICNLDEVEKCSESDLAYYDDNDLFNLSYQHGCYKAFYKRKSTKKSKDKMERVLLEKIQGIKHKIESDKYDLQYTENQLKELYNGNMDIYI